MVQEAVDIESGDESDSNFREISDLIAQAKKTPRPFDLNVASTSSSKSLSFSNHAGPSRVAPQSAANNVPPPSNDTHTARIDLALDHAINNATAEDLRKVLRAVCHESTESWKLVERRLLVSTNQIPWYRSLSATWEDIKALIAKANKIIGSNEGDEELGEYEEEEDRGKVYKPPDKRDFGDASQRESQFLLELCEKSLRGTEILSTQVAAVRTELDMLSAVVLETKNPQEWGICELPICVNCGKAFEPETKTDGLCKWHKGTSGFSWVCCDSDGNDEGCMLAKHCAPSSYLPPKDGISSTSNMKRKHAPTMKSSSKTPASQLVESAN